MSEAFIESAIEENDTVIYSSVPQTSSYPPEKSSELISSVPHTGRSAAVPFTGGNTASSAPPSSANADKTPAASSSIVISSAPATSKSALPADINFLGDVEDEIIALINAERERLSLSQLKYDPDLTRAARIRSRELYQNNVFAHTRPNGEGWQTVLETEVPYSYLSIGENLARVIHNLPDYDPAYDAYYWYDTWESSPPHYENIVKPRFTHIGVSIYYTQKDGMTYAYATTLFGQPG